MAPETVRNQVCQMIPAAFRQPAPFDDPHGTLVGLGGTPEKRAAPTRLTVKGQVQLGCRRQEPALRAAGPMSDTAATGAAKIRTQLSHQIMIAAMIPRARKFAASNLLSKASSAVADAPFAAGAPL